MNKETLAEVLNRTGIQTGEIDVSTLSPDGFIPGNRSNVWYFKHLGSEVVVKEYPDWVNSEDITWIHGYMRELDQKGFPLTKVIGSAVQKDDHYYGVYEYTSGSSFNKDNINHTSSLAKTLRKLYDLSRDIKIPGCRNWPTVYGYQPNVDRLASFDSYYGKELLEPTWKIAGSLLQDRTVSVMPIHGDFRRDNIRFDQSGITKVFDFGNSRNDYAEVDLAITLRDVDNLAIDPKDFLKTYRDSGAGKANIVPEAICASGLVLSIQECLYLWKESLQNPSTELKNALSRETEHLKFQFAVLPQKLSLYKEIFSC